MSVTQYVLVKDIAGDEIGFTELWQLMSEGSDRLWCFDTIADLLEHHNEEESCDGDKVFVLEGISTGTIATNPKFVLDTPKTTKAKKK